MTNEMQNNTIEIVLERTKNNAKVYEWDLEKELYISNKTFQNHTAAIRSGNDSPALITSGCDVGLYWHLDYNAAMNLFLTRESMLENKSQRKNSQKNESSHFSFYLQDYFFTTGYIQELTSHLYPDVKSVLSISDLRKILSDLLSDKSITLSEYSLPKNIWKKIRQELDQVYILPIRQQIPDSEKRKDSHPWKLDFLSLQKNTIFPKFLLAQGEKGQEFLFYYLSKAFDDNYQKELASEIESYIKQKKISAFSATDFTKTVISALNHGEDILLDAIPGKNAENLCSQYAVSLKTLRDLKKIILQSKYPLSVSNQRIYWTRLPEESTAATSVFEQSNDRSVRSAFILLILSTEGKEITQSNLYRKYRELLSNAEQTSLRASQDNTFKACLQQLLDLRYIGEDSKTDPLTHQKIVFYRITDKAPLLLEKKEEELLDIMHYLELFRSSTMTHTSLRKLADYMNNLFIDPSKEFCEWDTDKDMSIHLGKQPADSREYQHVKKLFHNIDYKNYAIHVNYSGKDPSRSRSDIIFTVSLYYTDEKNQFYLFGIRRKSNMKNSIEYKAIPVNRISSVEICQDIPNTTQTARLYVPENKENKPPKKHLTSQTASLYHNTQYMQVYYEMISGSPGAKDGFLTQLRFPGLANTENTPEQEKTHQELNHLVESRNHNVPDQNIASLEKRENDIIYSDTIRDLSEFNYYMRKFLHQYEIIEPESLKKIQRDSARRILTRYGDYHESRE